MEDKKIVQILTALAQETRLRISCLLVQAGFGGISAGHIAEALELPAATLSFHLKEMKHAGLVTCQKEGRSLIYAANYELMNDLMTYLTENCCRQSNCGEGETSAESQCDQGEKATPWGNHT